MRKTLTGIQKSHCQPKHKALALTLEQLHQIAVKLSQSNRLIHLRDNALIQIGFFGAFRRSELVAIQYQHITWHKEGLEILIPRSKTDTLGEGQVCALPSGKGLLCPVKSLKRYLKAADIHEDFVFRRFNKKGEPLESGISPRQVNLILQSIAERCGFDNPDNYSKRAFRVSH